MPHYAGYHRTVVGYHGTKRATALRIVQNLEGFDPSENDDDWLGHGIYFWEYAPQQAWLWARQRQRAQKWTDEIAVVASMIRLGACLDLLDPENVKALGRISKTYHAFAIRSGATPPTNVRARKRLNCAAFDYAYAYLAKEGNPIDTCRANFIPTTAAAYQPWAGSGINALAHIQACVRNANCILGTWLVKPMKEWSNAEGQET